MVGYDGGASKHLSEFDHAVAGAVAGIATRGIAQPLDVVKIRFQLQVEPLKQQAGAKYWSVSQALRLISKDEGVSALWKGHVPAQALSILYGVSQMISFEFLTRKMWFLAPQWQGKEYQPFIHFVCGGAAGVIASGVSFPFDVIRTRLIAQGESKPYINMRHAFKSIIKKEGARGFYRGFTPVLVQIAPHSGFQFSAYTLLHNLWDNSNGGKSHSPSAQSNLIIGAIAGILAKTAVYPLDVAKKRLQIVGFEESRACFGKSLSTESLIDCLRTTAKHEGLTGLFKGWRPSTMKAALVSALFFSFYEACH